MIDCNHQSSVINHQFPALEYPMPLFEYECRGCGKQFEYLTRQDQSPACPACHGVDLQKLLSVFAAQSDSPAKSFKSMPPAPCGSCGDPRGPGSCSTN
jgi:putative FmdB family regulatory protein